MGDGWVHDPWRMRKERMGGVPIRCVRKKLYRQKKPAEASAETMLDIGAKINLLPSCMKLDMLYAPPGMNLAIKAKSFKPESYTTDGYIQTFARDDSNTRILVIICDAKRH